MKMYREKENTNKSWCIRLVNDDIDTATVISNTPDMQDQPTVCAVDTLTGERICSIIRYYHDGSCHICGSVKQNLTDAGYDPYEHGNEFNSLGGLVYGSYEGRR